ncbi:MAG: 23S rRNA (pseudouridine(1915)-N(3))-methyltransferase RlmH [Alphaproteobacteria bacterium]|nr:23S rRNA (pseudouridine(1915)-N(3))-methyltransferase RlmH [Alphaproteobacteria bacterium]
MRLTIAAAGRVRDGPLRALYNDYARRLTWPLALKEVEERRKLTPARRIEAESRLLADAVPDGAVIVTLDQRGKPLSSEDFAVRLGRWQDDGVADIAFVIGGADGLDPSWRRRASLVLSLGPMTWPHLLARVMLAEQLYRAQSILAGHPYHRG